MWSYNPTHVGPTLLGLQCTPYAQIPALTLEFVLFVYNYSFDSFKTYNYAFA